MIETIPNDVILNMMIYNKISNVRKYSSVISLSISTDTQNNLVLGLLIYLQRFIYYLANNF